MSTFRMSKENAIYIVCGGETVAEAIKATWQRKYGCEVISITKPYAGNQYHVEHSGRDIPKYENGKVNQETIYSDLLCFEKEVEEL